MSQTEPDPRAGRRLLEGANHVTIAAELLEERNPNEAALLAAYAWMLSEEAIAVASPVEPD